MVTKLTYNSIQHLKPWDLIEHLQILKKGLVKDVLVIDLLNEETLKKPFSETYFIDLYPRGIYLFFDQDDCIRYVGKTHQGFYNRLMSQLDTTPMKHFGWNALLRIMGGNRTGKAHHDLCEEDHDVDFNEVVNYKLVLIDVGSWREVSAAQLSRLEKIIMKTFIEQETHRLVNTRIGWLRDHQWEQKIKDLIV